MMPTPDTPPPSARQRRVSGVWLVAAAVAAGIATVAIGALLTNIASRKAEGMNPFFRVVEITDTTTDPEVWGRNFPVHYDLYRRTVDMTRTRYGGSEAIPVQPSDADPRDTVAQSRLEEDPRLREFWAGYAFAEDFREERGHSYMLLDQVFTRRQDVAKQPGTCLHCHASVYVPYRKLGDGDLIKGFEKMNQMPFAQARRPRGIRFARLVAPLREEQREAARRVAACAGVRDHVARPRARAKHRRTTLEVAERGDRDREHG